MIRLTGQLICQTEDQTRMVARYLPKHVALSRAEPGCLSFDVKVTDNPLIWQVDEAFTDQAAFNAHQQRGAASEWGRQTAGLQRAFTVTQV